MADWTRCTVKEPFLDGDVIRWSQDMLEKKPKGRRELVKVGELEVTAQVDCEDKEGWVFLIVITSSVTLDMTETRRLHPPKKGDRIRRHRATILKGRSQRSKMAWDEEARDSVLETIKRDGVSTMPYNRRSKEN